MVATLAAVSIDQGRLNGLNRLMAAALIGTVVLFAAPTMLFVAGESWSTEEGTHGPIVLVTGVWLLWRQFPRALEFACQPHAARVWALLAVVLPLFFFARITQIVEVEGYLMYAALLVLLYSLIGAAALKELWFPLLYLAFIFPPPDTLVAAVTVPLKMELSRTAVKFLSWFGYPVGGEGVRIFIGQYELLVAAACSGLNSIISLSAISLFYIYMRHQANWRYALLLALLIVPVALAANFVRVIILILLTYHAGEAAAQGFLHNFAGIVMFAVALLLIFVVDEGLVRLWQNRKQRQVRYG